MKSSPKSPGQYRINATLTTLLSLFLVQATGSVLAMEAAAVRAPVDLPEEVVITNQRTLFELKQKIDEAEDIMYAIYNELNDVKIYDINCRMEVKKDSHLKEKVCKPGFMDKGLATDAYNSMMAFVNSAPEGNGPRPHVSLNGLLSWHYPKLEERMKEVLKESPEFQAAVTRHHELREELEARKTSYFQD